MRQRPDFCLLLALTVLSGCRGVAEEQIIRGAEAHLIMPLKDRPLSSYDRYYAIKGGFAVGRFFFVPGGKGKMTVVASEKDMPFAAGGGCSIVNTRLDLHRKVWGRTFCNGI
jgi:hypothetical protein